MEHAWFRVNCGFAACCFAIALFAGSGAHAQTPVVTGDAAALTREAGRMLDDLQIPNEVFEAAAGKLLQAITLDPGYAKAYVQLSRLEIMGGLEMGRRFAPMSVETAEKAVVKALDLDPSDGYAWVLKAHLYVDRHRLSEAKAALIRAEKAGTDSPWLMLNWAEVFEQEGDLESAAERYQAVLKSGTVNKRALRYAYRQLTGYYILKRDWENAEQMHLAHKQIDPYDAWAPTNFAASLRARASSHGRFRALAKRCGPGITRRHGARWPSRCSDNGRLRSCRARTARRRRRISARHELSLRTCGKSRSTPTRISIPASFPRHLSGRGWLIARKFFAG